MRLPWGAVRLAQPENMAHASAAFGQLKPSGSEVRLEHSRSMACVLAAFGTQSPRKF